MDREHWPETMKARLAEFRLEEISELMRQAALSARKKYFSETAWNKVVEMRRRHGQLMPPTWQAHVDLFRAGEAALAEDPGASKRNDSRVSGWLCSTRTVAVMPASSWD